eukprot:NODE_65_length_23997_cov_0.327601.p9 type:complete len:286 gc:universal NODE_65_length_23997_cov_0.327601:1027-170(-)
MGRTLYLCRHGETELNKNKILQGQGVDASLNDTGRKQAELLCNALQGVEYLAVTGLKRTKETALALNMHMNIYKELNEIHWGIYENRKSPNLTSILSEWQNGNFDCKSEGGESPNQVRNRSIAGLFRILKDSTHCKKVAVIAHGRLLRILISQLLHSTLYYMPLILHSNTCINEFQVEEFKLPASKWDVPTFLVQIEPFKDILKSLYNDLEPNSPELYFLHQKMYNLVSRESLIDPNSPSLPLNDSVVHSHCFFYKRHYWASVYGFQDTIYVFIALKINSNEHLQ